MFKFFDLIDREIKTFKGIYYDNTVKCDEIILLKAYKKDKIHICGTKLTMISPIMEGMDVFCTPMINLYPDMIYKL